LRDLGYLGDVCHEEDVCQSESYYMWTMVLFRLIIKCMQGLRSKWNGELVDLSGNGDVS
jgi:hypothetical protein